jgi:hypothetical protein
MIAIDNKLTEIQLELLKSFKHIANEKELQEVKSLLNFHFSKKLHCLYLRRMVEELISSRS